ncbi:uncharacterized protein LOC116207116 [Punica granatum]|uniref:Uncharacterized protein LOC116207116 n=1 Tax=Punica granatum TaxID=22663 RepID=A0A6P8DRD6_PUNGR|nr:uncharacterized protein LOC116207116 [Punica granatum]XP_031395836.1 uncharacterized protein LOC116207116 [Punica granatum]
MTPHRQRKNTSATGQVSSTQSQSHPGLPTAPQSMSPQVGTSNQTGSPVASIPADLVTKGTTIATKKRGRGLARGFQVTKRLKEGSKIDGVIISEDNYKPVGPAEKIFKMELGIITRLLAPLQVFYWKRMKNEMKEPLFARLESEFQISLSEPHTREVVDAAMADRYRQFKHNCRKHYRKFSTIEEARQNPPIDVEEADWISLCEHFESDEFKRASKANAANRSKLEVNHTSGSKSYCQRMYEMEISEDPRPVPKEVGVYYDAHHKRATGTWIHPKAQENYEQMKALHAQPTENDIPLTGREIFQEVVKPKSGYTRGLGYGARHHARPRSTARFYVEGNDSERESRQVLEQKIGSQQAQIESQQAQIGILQSSHASLEAQIRDLLGRLEARDSSHSNP